MKEIIIEILIMLAAFILMDITFNSLRRKRGNNMKLKVNNLEKYRTNLNLTQGQLAEKIFVSRNTVNSIENGRYIPSLSLASVLAKFFKCKIEDLFQFDLKEFKDD